MTTVNTRPTFSFSGSGKVVTDLAHSSNTPTHVALQSDGKIVVSGWTFDAATSDAAFVLVRHNPDGSLDTTFSNDGWVQTNLTPYGDLANTVIELPDTKLLAVGQADQRIGGIGKFALVRYNSDGSLDTSFSEDGIAVSSLRGDDAAGQIALTADGKLVVTGFSSAGFSSDFAVARYNSDGSLDTSFSGDGWTTTNFGLPYNDAPSSVAILANGKILVAGYTDGANGGRTGADFALARYNKDGTLDSTFSGGGLVTTDLGPEGGWDWATSMALLPNGKILLAGSSLHTLSSSPFTPSSPSYAVLVRYNADGTLDRTFSGDGKLVTSIQLSGTKIALQSDGKIVMAGSSPTRSFVVARFNADGRLDNTFSEDGKVDLGFGLDLCDLVLQADCKIIVTGKGFSDSTIAPDYVDMAVARLNADGSVDPSFGVATASGPVSTLDGTPTFYVGGAPVVLDSNVQVTDAELSHSGNYANAHLTLMRHGGANGSDFFATPAGSSLGPLTTGGSLKVNGVSIGAVTQNDNGILQLIFNSSASEGLVNAVLQQIAYGNSAITSKESVQIDWTFTDGNTGTQGNGGALAITASTIVSIASIQRQVRSGGATNDVLQGGSGDDQFDGGSGIDKAVILSSTVHPVRTALGWEVNGPAGHDLLLPNVERLQFTDGGWALDIAGNAGLVVRALGAVFGPTFARDEVYLGVGIAALDSGMSYVDLIQMALNFQLGVNASHSSVVELLYKNIVGLPASRSDLAYYVSLLDKAEMTAAQLGVFAADTALNASNVELTALYDLGVGYIG